MQKHEEVEEQKEIEDLYKIINPKKRELNDLLNSLLRNTAELIIRSGYRKQAPESSLVPSWKEPIDYEPMIDRAKIINKIHMWYKNKFKIHSNYEVISVFDIIADFIMDTKFGQPRPAVPSVESIEDEVKKVVISFWYRDRKDTKLSIDSINFCHLMANEIHRLLSKEQKG